MIALLLSPLYILFHIHFYRRLYIWMEACNRLFKRKFIKIIILAFYVFLSLSILIGFLLPNGTLKYLISGLGNIWLGLLLYASIVFTIMFFVKRIYFKKKKIPKRQIPKTRFYKLSGLISILIISIITIYGAFNAKNIRTTNYEITINKNSPIKNLNIVMVADLHIGYNLGHKQIKKMVTKINAQNPDLVIIAGDIFDNDYNAIDNPSKIVTYFQEIKSKYGIYAAYGNHDIKEKTLAGFTFDYNGKKVSDLRTDKLLQKAGIHLLREDYALIDNKFYIYGRPDYHRLGRGITKRKTPEEITNKLDKNLPIIVIDHQPRELQEMEKAQVDLDLSGHTHDGQLFPGNLVTKLMFKNSYGLYQKNSFTSIVTSGVGVYGPNMRVGTKSEITNIKVTFKKR